MALTTWYTECGHTFATTEYPLQDIEVIQSWIDCPDCRYLAKVSYLEKIGQQRLFPVHLMN